MATPSEHLRQADHNQRFLDAVSREDYPDWVATIAFYKAVHLVEALFAEKGHKSGSHTRRNRILKTQYVSIWRQYKTLYSFSRLARYWCMKVKPQDADYVEKRLAKVESDVRHRLK